MTTPSPEELARLRAALETSNLVEVFDYRPDHSHTMTAFEPKLILALLEAYEAQATLLRDALGALETSCDLTDALGAFLAEFEGRDEILLAELNERVIAVRREVLTRAGALTEVETEDKRCPCSPSDDWCSCAYDCECRARFDHSAMDALARGEAQS